MSGSYQWVFLLFIIHKNIWLDVILVLSQPDKEAIEYDWCLLVLSSFLTDICNCLLKIVNIDLDLSRGLCVLIAEYNAILKRSRNETYRPITHLPIESKSSCPIDSNCRQSAVWTRFDFGHANNNSWAAHSMSPSAALFIQFLIYNQTAGSSVKIL